MRNNTIKFLRKNYENLYNKYRKYNPDNINFKKVTKSCKIWSEENVIKEINKYNSKKELLKNNRGAYQVVHKKFRHLLPLYKK